MSDIHSIKRKIGAILYDWPAYEWNIREMSLGGARKGHWTRIRNRYDELIHGPDGRGVQVIGRWTSSIHVCDVFPSLGRRLMKKALDEWPVEVECAAPDRSESPDVSFILGHRGLDRLPHLELVLRSIAGQVGVSVECIVVEQSPNPEIIDSLPPWVHSLHIKIPDGSMPYSRSWAFNVGAREAQGRILVFHDGDLLVPEAYGREVVDIHQRGFELINLKRFIFYLTREETRKSFRSGGARMDGRVETVLQNAKGGGSLAVDRETFFDLGGFDEAFVGWGGEDNEFWERSSSRSVWPFGYLPMIHLWHRPQPERLMSSTPAVSLLEARSKIAPGRRVQELRARDFGNPEQMDPPFRGS